MTFVVPQLPLKATAAASQSNGDSQETQEHTLDSSASASASTSQEQEKKGDDSVFAMPTAPVKRASASGSMPPPPPPLFPKEQQQREILEPSSSDTDRFTTQQQQQQQQQQSSKPSGPPPNAPPLKYQKPAWSGYPNQQFFFEVIKNGVLVDKIQAPLREFLTIGRLPMCDLEMEHPSLSRYHAVIQFKSSGETFIYDLNSSHGTKVNKTKIPPQMHVKIKPGDQLRFGESTRIYLFQTEETVDQEEEERETVKKMIEKQNREKPARSKEEEEEEEFNSWGMAPDAVDEDDMDDSALMDGSGPRRQVDPDASYRKDPKKALRHYLESKGYSCEFEVEESGPGHAREYTARIRLPIETSMGPVYGQATTGKRREAEREAALDACIQLDSRGMLNNNKASGEGSSSHSRAQKVENSDDDDDDFYDRTAKKKKSSAKSSHPPAADTHDSLLQKHSSLLQQISALETQIRDFDATAAARKQLEDSGDLDAYMASLEKEKSTSKESKPKLIQMLAAMRKEEKRLMMLIEYTKPVDILAKIGSGPAAGAASATKSQQEQQPAETTAKRQSEANASPDVTEVKRPRVLGPSLPPPS
ncbi:Kanadaptin [Linnemannia schmuckeri]|uniref:Kanadaptin n=1 Tax=Linnemannia schmuckeri TaxID=64567 RepID=A0A9P5S2Q2_9FUNG|nr:Kanadaptin [Linnemannia schmuckeri]